MKGKNNINLAANLRFFRKTNNYSQEKVARMMNIDRSQISRYENGEDYPSIDILIKFAKLYKTSLDDLVGYESERTNKISQLLSSLNDNNFKLLVMIIEPVINVIKKYTN